MAETVSALGNIALLIDADNVSHKKLDAVLAVLAEFGPVNIRRAYGNWQKEELRGWAGKLLSHALEPVQQFDITTGKSATDMRMTIDAMDLLLFGEIDAFGIFSSDSDFMPLAMQIRRQGIPVYGFGEAVKTPVGFQAACTRFLDVAALTNEGEAEPGKVRSVQPIDDTTIAVLVGSYEQAKHDNDGFAHLGEVGARARNTSSFHHKNHGFSRLTDMIEQLPGFEVQVRDGATYVRYKQ